MKFKSLRALLTSSFVATSLVCAAPMALATESRNVILIIGDGMDDQQITIARNYLKGSQGQLLLDTMPVRGVVQVLTVSEESPTQPVYVADSANSATAMATGVRTSRGRIATSAKEDKDLSTVAEQAKSQGWSVGIVTTANVTDATPASFIAHINQRGCENTDMMVNAKVSGNLYTNCKNDLKANNGKGSIAEQIADSSFDIILGGGQKHFATLTEAGNSTILEAAQNNNHHTIDSAEQLTNLPADKNILGLFSSSTMPVKWQGENGRIAEQAEPSLLNYLDWRLGSVELPKPMKCEANPAFTGMPTLPQMTSAALKKLSINSKGFFLMIESASIDKQSHKRNPCGSIGELEQLEDTLALALEFTEKNPQTLIMVTADHGQAAHIIPDESLFKAIGVPVYTPGHVARITTPEGSNLAVNYATNEFPYEEHTGVNVAIFSNQQGRNIIAPMIRQTDIYAITKQYLQLQ